VPAFGAAVHTALKDSVAGYAMQLRRHGKPIYTLQWQWARQVFDPSFVDPGVAWGTDVRMHVASCSKLVTAIAMTRLLRERGISPDALIAPYLPSYWSRGANIDKITFAMLLTHTSGFNNGTSSASDFAFMKSRVAMGVSATGGYKYENMNFGLCRILLA